MVAMATTTWQGILSNDLSNSSDQWGNPPPPPPPANSWSWVSNTRHANHIEWLVSMCQAACALNKAGTMTLANSWSRASNLEGGEYIQVINHFLKRMHSCECPPEIHLKS